MSINIILFISLIFTIIALIFWVIQLRKSLRDHFMIERELQYEIGHDELTDLVSSTIAIDRLAQSMKNAKRYGNKIAVLYIGVDYFKQVNSASGFDVTNEFLQTLALRFVDIVGRVNTVFRENENEFIVILEDVEDVVVVNDMVDKIMEIANEIFEIQHHKIKSTFSIGISMFPLDDVQTMTILSHACSAMQLVRENGGDNYKFYTRALSQEAFEHLKLEYEIIDSLEKNQIEVHYQIVYDVKTKVAVGIESFARWMHPLMGLIPADKFIRLSREIGYDIEIDRWVLKEVISQMKKYKEKGFEVGNIFINTSFSSFEYDDFIEDIKNYILSDDLLKNNIYFEITQTHIFNNKRNIIKKIDELSKIGVKFSIDNCANSFSFADMKSISFDMLKIDRDLISNLNENKNTIKSMIAIAKNMGLQVTANGVQTQAEYTFLLENGCDNVQGDYFNEVCSPRVIENILKKLL